MTGAVQTPGDSPASSGVTPWTRGNRLVGYDPVRRRVWVGGQRLHHGATGFLLATAGVVLCAHDWKDRSVWFRRGQQVG